MAKVTSKLQVTVPKALATQYRIAPGDEIEWIAAGDTIRVQKRERRPPSDARSWRLELFDRATKRQRQREAVREPTDETSSRGWKREDLYDRGGAG